MAACGTENGIAMASMKPGTLSVETTIVRFGGSTFSTTPVMV